MLWLIIKQRSKFLHLLAKLSWKLDITVGWGVWGHEHPGALWKKVQAEAGDLCPRNLPHRPTRACGGGCERLVAARGIKPATAEITWAAAYSADLGHNYKNLRKRNQQ